MANFSLALIKPVSKSTEFGQTSNARSAKEVLLTGIEQQLKLFREPATEGRRWFRSGKSETAFALKYSNRALVLVDGETQAVVPTDKFEDALAYFKAEVSKGVFDEQLKALEGARTERTNKMRATRAAKKDAKPS